MYTHAGVQSLTLFSSPTSEGGIIRSCLHTNITITCTATQVKFLRWNAEPGLRDQGYTFTSIAITNTFIEADGFTITLVNLNNVMDIHADFISTLEVMSVDLMHNITTVTCRAGENEKQLVINKLDE